MKSRTKNPIVGRLTIFHTWRPKNILQKSTLKEKYIKTIREYFARKFGQWNIARRHIQRIGFIKIITTIRDYIRRRNISTYTVLKVYTSVHDIFLQDAVRRVKYRLTTVLKRKPRVFRFIDFWFRLNIKRLILKRTKTALVKLFPTVKFIEIKSRMVSLSIKNMTAKFFAEYLRQRLILLFNLKETIPRMIRRASVAYSGLYIGAFGKYKRPLRSHRQKWQKGGVCPNRFRSAVDFAKVHLPLRYGRASLRLFMKRAIYTHKYYIRRMKRLFYLLVIIGAGNRKRRLFSRRLFINRKAYFLQKKIKNKMLRRKLKRRYFSHFRLFVRAYKKKRGRNRLIRGYSRYTHTPKKKKKNKKQKKLEKKYNWKGLKKKIWTKRRLGQKKIVNNAKRQLVHALVDWVLQVKHK